MFYGIGLLTGLILGYFLSGFINKVRKGINLKLFGYELTINKAETFEILEPTKKKYRKLPIK